jgi:hypothetical protein
MGWEDPGMLVGIALTALFVGVITIFILVGLRQRPELELPPRFPPPPPPVTRTYWVLFGAGQAGIAVAVIGAVVPSRPLMVTGLVLMLGSQVLRVTVRLRQIGRFRRQRAEP